MKKGLMLASTPLTNDGLTKIEVDVIKYNKDDIEFDIACGFDISNDFRIKLRGLCKGIYRLPNKKNVLSYMHSIRKLVRKGQYDFVYIHGNSAMMVIETMPAKMGGCRVVTHCHNTKSNYPFIHYIVKPMFNLLVDAKIGCSSFSSKWAYCGKRIITITNGIDVNRFKFDENARKKIRNDLGWNDSIIVGHIGRFSYQKNHERLIEIFDQFQRVNDRARLLLIGDGELHSEVECKIDKLNISEKIKFVKHTEEPEKYMSAMDIFVMPSRFEGMCLVAVEAQANGLPTLLDSIFAPETFASDNVAMLDLNDTNEKWSTQIQNMIDVGRIECTDELIQKGYDHTVMMKKIQEVLLNEL